MLDQLEALRALKEEGTTARAAVRLRLTQSAISKRIDALEAEVGAPLIEAHGRGCRLTPAGEALVGIPRTTATPKKSKRFYLSVDIKFKIGRAHV